MSIGPGALKRFAPLLLIVAALVAAYALGWTDYLSLGELRERREVLGNWVEANPVLSVAAFAGLYCLIVAFSIPGALIMTLAGGFLFGAVVIYLAARSAFGDVLRRKAGSAVARFEQGVREHAFSYIVTLRLLPIFPFWLVNIGLALVNVHSGPSRWLPSWA